MKPALGILGGLGPIASCEFLKTLYELNVRDSEQDAPRCFLYSDPSFPKRTEAIDAGQDRLLIDAATEALQKLADLGSSKIVIACVTIHYFLPNVPAHLQAKVVSLLDIIVDLVLANPGRYLLLCSIGARKTEIFPRHSRWEKIASHIVFPDEEDAKIIHNCFETVKVCGGIQSTLDFFDRTYEKYEVDGFVLGCSELHLANKHLLATGDRRYRRLDPLMAIAENLDAMLADRPWNLESLQVDKS